MIGLAYHYLSNTCNLYEGIHPLDWYTFERQIDKLKKNSATLTFDENINFYLNEKNDFAQKKYLLTFDDGLKEHLKAAEILSQKGIKAIFAIIGCATFRNKMPLVHKLHWLRSNIEINILTNKLEEIKDINFLIDENTKKKAQAMHIHDDLDTAILKYNLNFLIDYSKLDYATSKLINLYAKSEKELCNKSFLNIDEIKKIDKLGHIIAWHTDKHIPMSKLSKKELKRDLDFGYEFLKKINSKSEKHLCYPYGRIDALPLKNLDYVLSSKFKYAWTLEKFDKKYFNPKYNNLLLQRITTNELFKNDTQLIS